MDVVAILDEDSKHLVPLAHIIQVRDILGNLRTAGFGVKESNILIRALYSWHDEVNGETHRIAAWDLLITARPQLKLAADKLAHILGEFRTKKQEYKLAGAQALENEPPRPEGLQEDEFQLLVNMLGEHLSEQKLAAIFIAIEADLTGDGVVSYSEAARILKYMDPHHHLRHLPDKGSISGHERAARKLQNARASQIAEEEGGATVEGGAFAWLQNTLGGATDAVDRARKRLQDLTLGSAHDANHDETHLVRAVFQAGDKMGEQGMYFA